MPGKTPETNVSFTAPINPPGAAPVLNVDQIWAALEQKVPHAEWFVAGALKSTDVISVDEDEHGHRRTTREVVFVDGDKRIREVCTEYPKMKIDFTQPGGGLVTNIVSRGDQGPEDLYLTYTFHYLHPGASEQEIAELMKKREGMSKMAVIGTIEVIRRMVKEGKIN